MEITEDQRQCQICRVVKPRRELKWVHAHLYCEDCYQLVMPQKEEKTAILLR